MAEAVDVHGAINAGMPGPVVVRGIAIQDSLDTHPMLCERATATIPPGCVPPYLLLEGLDVSTLPRAEATAGATYVDRFVALKGTLSEPEPGRTYACHGSPQPEPWVTWNCVNGWWLDTRDPNAPPTPTDEFIDFCPVTPRPGASETPDPPDVEC